MKTTRIPHAPTAPLPELAEFLAPFRVHFRRSEGPQALERYLTGLLTEPGEPRRALIDEYGTHPELTWGEVAQMQDSGAFVVESHGTLHRDLQQLSEHEQQGVVGDSRLAMRELVNHGER